MTTVRMRVTAIIISSGCTMSCSTTAIDRSPSFESDTNVRLVSLTNSDGFSPNRHFQTEEPIQDVKVCGVLFKVGEDFYVRSSCSHGDDEKYYGVSKVPAEYLLKESQGTVWSHWAESAQKTGKGKAPFVCFIGRGNGDPCNRKSGALIQRVRRFTSDEDQFNKW